MTSIKNISRFVGRRTAALLASLLIIATLLAVSRAAVAEDMRANQPSASLPAKVHRLTKRHPPQPKRAELRSFAVNQPAAETNAVLPNGASSITENYGDWIVNCRIENGQKVCVISQEQGNRQSGQRIFAIELRSPEDGNANGTILMPFGLKLENGATLKLDDKDLGKGLRFSTCVPEGCLLPVAFPSIATDAMKTAKTLTVSAFNLSDNNAVKFSVSLQGFATALARVTALGM